MAEKLGVNDNGSVTDTDALRLDAHRLREASRALAQQALEARQVAKDGRQRAESAKRESVRVSEVSAELRLAVTALAKQLRALGESPEAVVIAVKNLSADAARIPLSVPVTRGEQLQLTYDLVRWAVQAYYAA